MMTKRAEFAFLAFLVLICLPFAIALAGDAPTVPVRLGTHPDYGRIVFDLPAHVAYHVTQDGDHVTIQFDNTGKVASARGGTRNVLSVTGGDGKAELVIGPGATLRDQQYGNRVVIDVLDAAAKTASSAQKSMPKEAPPTPPQPQATAPPPRHSSATVSTDAAAQTPAELPATSAPPATTVEAQPASPPPTPGRTTATRDIGCAVQLPVGIATFRRGPRLS